MGSKPGNYNSRTADKFVIRLPEGMRDQISDLAKCYRRSMNSEIISRLESSLKRDSNGTNHLPNKLEAIYAATLTEAECSILEYWRSLPENKQDAFLKLIEE